jgi:hypothetical protein
MSGILGAYTGGSYGAVPGAPTIGTVTAGNALACVAFTAPTCTGIPPTITSYQVVCVATGSNNNTGASSPIQVTGLINCTSYQFKVRATNATGYGAYSCNSSSVTPSSKGSQSYTTAGTYSWVAPAGVTKVSVVAVGGGGGGTSRNSCGTAGSGGALGYKNNITVVPGNCYTVVVGSAGSKGTKTVAATSGGDSYFINNTTVKGGGGKNPGSTASTYVGDGGGAGGLGVGNRSSTKHGGGGAGGYSGSGGQGADPYCTIGSGGQNGTSGSGGGGGGGGGLGGQFCNIGYYNCCGYNYQYTVYLYSGGGGGVGLFGQGSNGAGRAGYSSLGGGGGSGGAQGGGGQAIRYNCSTYGPDPGVCGGNYGGGGASLSFSASDVFGGNGGLGAVRIVWPGCSRTFPSTCVGSP